MATKLEKVVKPYLTPVNLVISFVILAFIVILAVVLFQRLFPGKVNTITENQIRIQRGEKIVLVDANGLVEYRTPDGIFYEVWDSARIHEFFTSMQEKAKKYLENPNPEACETGYTVTLYLEGEEVTICLEEDEELDELYDEFVEGSSDDSLSQIFDDLFSDGENGEEGTFPGTPTPTPTPLIVSGEEGGETPGDGNGGGFEVVECALYEQLVTTRTVISNTLCVVAPSPTPAPTP